MDKTASEPDTGLWLTHSACRSTTGSVYREGQRSHGAGDASLSLSLLQQGAEAARSGSFRIDVEQLASTYDRVDHGGAPAGVGVAHEKPVAQPAVLRALIPCGPAHECWLSSIRLPLASCAPSLLSGRGTNLGVLTHLCNNSGQSSASGARTLALGRIGQDGANMLPRDAREIFEDLIFGHPTGEVLEDIGGGDAGSDAKASARHRLWARHGTLSTLHSLHVPRRKGQESLAASRLGRARDEALHVASASRDEAIFDDPDRFDISRENAKKHTAFGAFSRLCLGAPLARLEVKTAVRAILERLPAIKLSPEQGPLEYSNSIIVPSIKRLLVTF
jgi:Cytochrome P450